MIAWFFFKAMLLLPPFSVKYRLQQRPSSSLLLYHHTMVQQNYDQSFNVRQYTLLKHYIQQKSVKKSIQISIFLFGYFQIRIAFYTLMPNISDGTKKLECLQFILNAFKYLLNTFNPICMYSKNIWHDKAKKN